MPIERLLPSAGPSSTGQRTRSDISRIRWRSTSARAAATFESAYIFCWLEWDGDNILTDGSILDYGSVRQFGLFHRDYRFEDVDRFSTSLTEQRRKARQIVQRFAQVRDLLLSGRLSPLSKFRNDPTLARFDRVFDQECRRLFLHQIGFEPEQVAEWVEQPPDALRELMRIHRRFEKCRSSRGLHRVPDGLSWNAIYCMRDVLRELPQRLLEEMDQGASRIDSAAFLELALSDYASPADCRATAYRHREALAYQRLYCEVLSAAAHSEGRDLSQLLIALAPRAVSRNPYARMTGDGFAHASKQLAKHCGNLSADEVYRLIEAFADVRDATPGVEPRSPRDLMEGERPLVRRLHEALHRLSVDFRESL